MVKGREVGGMEVGGMEVGGGEVSRGKRWRWGDGNSLARIEKVVMQNTYWCVLSSVFHGDSFSKAR